MDYTTLGKTDVKISRICLGTMTWGCQNTEAEGHEQMDYALERGINFFDTAEMYAVPPSPETYGKTEEIIGTWFAKTGNRDKVVLASKIAGVGPAWIRDGKNTIDRENIISAVESSLKRLQTDYIDLYQLHWPNRGSYHFSNYFNFEPTGQNAPKVKENFLEVLQTLNDLVQQGKIKHIGLSDESSWGVMQYLKIAEEHNLPRMVSIQNEHSLLCRKAEPDLAEVCANEAVSFLPWSPLAMGVISGKYLNGAVPEGARFGLMGADTSSWRLNPEVEQATKEYLAVAKKHGLDVCQMAIAFTLQQKFVASTIIGATNMQQLKTDVDAIDLKLTEDVLADIAAVRKKFPTPF